MESKIPGDASSKDVVSDEVEAEVISVPKGEEEDEVYDLGGTGNMLEEADKESGKTEDNPKDIDAKDGLEIWKRHRKHILVFSNAGKPIYTRYGNENTLSSMFGLLQAIASSTFDTLRVVNAGKQKIVFLIRDPISLVCISKTLEPVAYIEKQLSYIHSHILFHITLSALVDAFTRKPNFDLRALWGGPNIKGEIQGLLKLAHYSPSLMLDAVPSLYLPFQTRCNVIEILQSIKQSNLIYAVLIADKKVVAHVSPKKHLLHSEDLILLINFVDKAKQLRSQETWTPLCLPVFNSTGFLHAYAAFISQQVCLILLSAGEDLEQFHYCSSSKEKIAKELEESRILTEIEMSLSQPMMIPHNCNAAAAIHVLYKCSNSHQFMESGISTHAPLFQTERKRIIRRYAQVQDRAISSTHSQETPENSNSLSVTNSMMANLHIKNVSPTLPSLYTKSQNYNFANDDGIKVRKKKGDRDKKNQDRKWTHWDVGIMDAVLTVRTSEYEAYATFHPYATAAQAKTCMNRFLDWKATESENIFLLKKPTW